LKLDKKNGGKNCTKFGASWEAGNKKPGAIR